MLCIIITLFAVTLMGEREQTHILTSHSGYYMAVVLDKTHAVLPVEMNEQVHGLIHKLDESLPEDYEPHHDHDGENDLPTLPSVPVGTGPFGLGTGGGNSDEHTADKPSDGGLFDLR